MARGGRGARTFTATANRIRRRSTPGLEQQLRVVAARGVTPATGNAGGGSGSSDPNKNRGSRRAASATGPAPVVRPRPSEARAARGRLIRQIANRRQNARRSQRTT